MMFPLVLDLAADKIPVAVTCRVLGFSKQAFRKWKANPVTARDWDDAHLVNAASSTLAQQARQTQDPLRHRIEDPTARLPPAISLMRH
jgi:hypothetical protein